MSGIITLVLNTRCLTGLKSTSWLALKSQRFYCLCLPGLGSQHTLLHPAFCGGQTVPMLVQLSPSSRLTFCFSCRSFCVTNNKLHVVLGSRRERKSSSLGPRGVLATQAAEAGPISSSCTLRLPPEVLTLGMRIGVLPVGFRCGLCAGGAVCPASGQHRGYDKAQEWMSLGKKHSGWGRCVWPCGHHWKVLG